MKALFSLLLGALFAMHDAQAHASVKPAGAPPAKFQELPKTPEMG